MNFVPPTFTPAPGVSETGGIGHWTALEQAARVVATLAGVEPEAAAPAEDDLPARIWQADSWRRTRAEAGVADLAAIMEPGLAALLEVNARGADPRPAAAALWREFAAARAAILALLPPRSA
jgi:hypothetical protein